MCQNERAGVEHGAGQADAVQGMTGKGKRDEGHQLHREPRQLPFRLCLPVGHVAVELAVAADGADHGVAIHHKPRGPWHYVSTDRAHVILISTPGGRGREEYCGGGALLNNGGVCLPGAYISGFD